MYPANLILQTDSRVSQPATGGDDIYDHAMASAPTRRRETDAGPTLTAGPPLTSQSHRRGGAVDYADGALRGTPE